MSIVAGLAALVLSVAVQGAPAQGAVAPVAPGAPAQGAAGAIVTADTMLTEMALSVAAPRDSIRWMPEAIPVGLTRQPPARRDTVRAPRRRAVVYSDGYGTRVAIHKTLSWAMLPLFAVSYVSGDKMLDAYQSGTTPPDWAKTIHPIAATSTAVLFGANTVTGVWNLWEGRRDPNGRVKRFVHSGLFMLASGGFAYTGTQLADKAEESNANRRTHRNFALASMGVATSSWLLMLLGN